jgi:hypothetical protein
MYVLIFSTMFFSETFLILRTEQNMIINVYWSTCKVPNIIVRFKLNLNFLDWISKYAFIQYSV